MFPPVELIQSHGLNRVHNLLHFLTIVRTHNETLFLPETSPQILLRSSTQ